MKNLFITTHGLKISKSGSYIKIKGKEIDEKIPIGAFNNVFILSNVNLTTPLIKFLSKHNKFIFIINTAGRLKSTISPEILTSNKNTRKKQYIKFSEEKKCFQLTLELLKRKALISHLTLKSFEKAKGINGMPYFYKDFYYDALNYLYKSNTLEQLRGIDGFIMRTLYGAFSSAIRDFFPFKKRSYHPPKDEANAILSIVFSIVYSLLIPYITSFNLDPYEGFFHVKRGKHAILASDLLEILRPKLVFFVADIINRGFFQLSDFKKIKNGTYLKPKATKVLCKLLMEKLVFQNFFYPVEIFIKEEILK